jgi:hypothetical protein
MLIIYKLYNTPLLNNNAIGNDHLKEAKHWFHPGDALFGSNPLGLMLASKTDR